MKTTRMRTRGKDKDDGQQRRQGHPHPLLSQWTNDGKERLLTFISNVVDIMDTHYEGKLALKERELDSTVYNMSWEKREKLQRILDKLNVEESFKSFGESINPRQAHMTPLVCRRLMTCR